jgi:hypothetical protein
MNRKVLPRFAPSDDIEKLSTALKKMNSAKLPYLDDAERSESVCSNLQCTHTTHRCHHAAHAYTGVPCAAYSEFPIIFLKLSINKFSLSLSM